MEKEFAVYKLTLDYVSLRKTAPESFTIDLSVPFVELLCNRMDIQAYEGYNADSMLIWEPVFIFYQNQIREILHDDNIDLKDYVKESYDITIHVIGMDQREPEWLKEMVIYVYKEVK